MITASSLARLRACPSSAALPRAENHNEWADIGHDEHEVLSDFDSLEPRLAQWVPPGSKAEAKFRYNVKTGTSELIGYGGDRNYGEPHPDVIAGSCDVLGFLDGRVVIVDWKTGFADVEPARSNAQLWYYALAACRTPDAIAQGINGAIIRIVYTQTGYCDSYEIDSIELATYAAQLERVHAQVTARRAAAARNEVLDTREGAWCKHCSSKFACPSKNALLVQIAERGTAAIGDVALTAERARSLYEFLGQAEAMIKEAKKRLDTFVDEQGPIDLGDGKLYGRYVKMGNEKVDGEIALRAIREVCGEYVMPFELGAITMSTSKAAIQRAAKAVGQPQLNKAVLGRIRALGGIKAEEKRPIGEYMRGEHAAAEAIDFPLADVNKLLAEVA